MIGVHDGGMGGRHSLSTSLRSSAHSRDRHRASSFRRSTLLHHCCCLPIPMTLAMGESEVPACGPPASFSDHLPSSAVTPAGYVHKSSGAYVCAVEEMMCVVCVSVTEGA